MILLFNLLGMMNDAVQMLFYIDIDFCFVEIYFML